MSVTYRLLLQTNDDKNFILKTTIDIREVDLITRGFKNDQELIDAYKEKILKLDRTKVLMKPYFSSENQKEEIIKIFDEGKRIFLARRKFVSIDAYVSKINDILETKMREKHILNYLGKFKQENWNFLGLEKLIKTVKTKETQESKNRIFWKTEETHKSALDIRWEFEKIYRSLDELRETDKKNFKDLELFYNKDAFEDIDFFMKKIQKKIEVLSDVNQQKEYQILFNTKEHIKFFNNHYRISYGFSRSKRFKKRYGDNQHYYSIYNDLNDEKKYSLHRKIYLENNFRLKDSYKDYIIEEEKKEIMDAIQFDCENIFRIYNDEQIIKKEKIKRKKQKGKQVVLKEIHENLKELNYSEYKNVFLEKQKNKIENIIKVLDESEEKLINEYTKKYIKYIYLFTGYVINERKGKKLVYEKQEAFLEALNKPKTNEEKIRDIFRTYNYDESILSGELFDYVNNVIINKIPKNKIPKNLKLYFASLDEEFNKEYGKIAYAKQKLKRSQIHDELIMEIINRNKKEQKVLIKRL